MSSPIDTASVLIVPEMSDFSRALRSGVDGALRELKAQINAAFESIEKGARGAGDRVGEDFQRGGERAEEAFRELVAAVRVSMREIEASAARTSTDVGSRFAEAGAFAKTALTGFGVAATAGLVALTGFGLKSAGSLEQTQVAFDSLLGSAAEGKKVFDSLKQFAAVTPFELGDITPLAQKFLAFSGNVGLSKGQLEEFLTVAGNIVSVTGGGAQALDSIGLAFSHISSGGKVSLEDINILSDALPGFSGVAAIATATGMSTGEAMDAISAGAIDAKTGVAALLAGMRAFPGTAGAMERQSQTLLGVFSTFKDTASQALSGAFAPVIPEIKDSLSELTPVIGSAIGQLAPALGTALAKILPLIGKLIEAIVPILTPILDALGPALDALGPALVPLGEAIGQVLVALEPVLPVLAQFIAVIAELAVPVLKLLAIVLTPLTPVLNYMALAIGEVSKALSMIDWTKVGAAIAGWAVDAWHAVADFFVGVGHWFAELPAAADRAGTQLRDAFLTYLGNVLDYVISLPGRFIAIFESNVAGMIQAGKNLIFGIWDGISSLGGWLWKQVTDFIYNNTVGAAKHILGISSPSTVFADEVGEQIPAGVAVGVRGGMSDLQGLLSPIVPSSGSGAGGAATAGTSFGGGIVVNVNFVGVVPTAEEARRTGQQAGDGIMQAIARRNVGLAVRMGVSG